MARTTTESKAVRDDLAGHNVAASVPIPELIAITGGDVRGRFASLENDLTGRLLAARTSRDGEK